MSDMEDSKRTLPRLLLGLLLLLPLGYWGWYLALEWILAPVMWLADFSLTVFFPHQVAHVSHEGHFLVVLAKDQMVMMQDPRSGNVVNALMPGQTFRFDASIAGSGMPLFVALMLLASSSVRDVAKGVLVGVPLLWLQHAIVLVSMVLIHPFFFKTIVWSDGLSGKIADHAVHTTNTLGMFVLPALMPILLCLVLYPRFVSKLMPALKALFPPANASDNPAS